MKFTDFYQEGTTLLFVKRDNEENYFYQLFYFIVSAGFSMFILGQIPISWLANVLKGIVIVFLLLVFFIKDMTEKNRPQNSKHFIYIINGSLIYERITPEKEGYNKDNDLTNFEIVKFIDEKGSEIKIISNNELPWGKRKIQISKEYMPYKPQIIKYLNKNYTLSRFEAETNFLLKKHIT